MNKLDLIESLKTEAGLTKNEAVAVVLLFFDEWQIPRPTVTGWKSGDCARFMLRNTNHTSVEIQKPAIMSGSSRRSCRFLNVERN